MKIIDVPVFNEDGSIKFTSVVNAEEAQTLLQFAINFLANTGMTVQMLTKRVADEEELNNKQLND